MINESVDSEPLRVRWRALILGRMRASAQRKYPPELIERAVRMVTEKQRETPGRPGISREVGDLLGIHPEALRHWVKKHNAQAVPQAIAAREESERIRWLEK